MISTDYKRTKLACYLSYFTMSSIFVLPPLLFVTLHDLYHISYTLLGTLVLINFFTQLGVDLFFAVFSKHFPVKKVLRIMPLITSLGLVLYGLLPRLFPQFAYGGLVIGTIVFSLSAGLSEVLLSPTIAAIPSENPQRDMSMLHSLYAFGVVTMVAICSVFFRLFGTENYMWLSLFLACLTVIPAVLFMISPIPDIQPQTEEKGPAAPKKRWVGLVLCAFCIFFGSCAENTMTNWVSSYLEQVLHLDKALGDILGLALFAILLGAVRISYAKFGKRIQPVLLIGMLGAAICYLIAGFSISVPLAFIACILTGLFTSMLWPGTLILMEEEIPRIGVFGYALMAAAGDFGASLAPQLLGIVTDRVSMTSAAIASGAPAQMGLRAGMQVTAIFPILGVITLLITFRYFKKHSKK